MLLDKTLLLSTTQLIDMHWQKIINEVKTLHYLALPHTRLHQVRLTRTWATARALASYTAPGGAHWSLQEVNIKANAWCERPNKKRTWIGQENIDWMWMHQVDRWRLDVCRTSRN